MEVYFSFLQHYIWAAIWKKAVDFWNIKRWNGITDCVEMYFTLENKSAHTKEGILWESEFVVLKNVKLSKMNDCPKVFSSSDQTWWSFVLVTNMMKIYATICQHIVWITNSKGREMSRNWVKKLLDIDPHNWLINLLFINGMLVCIFWTLSLEY